MGGGNLCCLGRVFLAITEIAQTVRKQATLKRSGFSSTHGPYSMQKPELLLFYITTSII